MSRVYFPTNNPEKWQAHLADPEKHWKDGYSAKQLATKWLNASGFPSVIQAILTESGEPFASLAPLLILPEHKVPLPGGIAASQNDVWVLASHTFGLASIVAEGKVKEAFGPTMREWLVDASVGKKERLAYLLQTLGLPTPVPDSIRYQLLHRVASAIIEAKRFRANVAVCLVHSFDKDDSGFDDFEAFCSLYPNIHPSGQGVVPNSVISLGIIDGIALYVGWVRDTLP